jgi:hypothetical protein
MFLMDWYLSLFTKALPLDTATQVLDCYLCEGEVYLLCVALGVLKMFAPRLSALSFENISDFLLHLPANTHAEELLEHVAQISRKIPAAMYAKTRDKMRAKCGIDASSSQPHVQINFPTEEEGVAQAPTRRTSLNVPTGARGDEPRYLPPAPTPCSSLVEEGIIYEAVEGEKEPRSRMVGRTIDETSSEDSAERAAWRSRGITSPSAVLAPLPSPGYVNPVRSSSAVETVAVPSVASSGGGHSKSSSSDYKSRRGNEVKRINSQKSSDCIPS